MHEDGNGLSVKPNLPSLELQKDVIDVSHQNGFLAVGHATSLQGTLDLLRLGIDGLTHTFCDQPPTQEVIDAYLANNAYVFL